MNASPRPGRRQGSPRRPWGRSWASAGRPVSKWESGQAVPDLDTVAKLCLALGFSADYLLFGRETAPAESAPAEPAPGPVYPDTCPCCGRPTSGGTLCPACGYPLPALPFPGPRYALTCGARYFASIGSAGSS